MRTFRVSSQEAFAGYYLGPELCVIKWNTPLLRHVNYSPLQWRCLSLPLAIPEYSAPRKSWEDTSFLKMFERGNPIMTWRQSQENFSLQSSANGDNCMLPIGLQGIFQKDSASSFNLADSNLRPKTALFKLSHNPLAGCEITWSQPIFFNETE